MSYVTCFGSGELGNSCKMVPVFVAGQLHSYIKYAAERRQRDSAAGEQQTFLCCAEPQHVMQSVNEHDLNIAGPVYQKKHNCGRVAV